MANQLALIASPSLNPASSISQLTSMVSVKLSSHNYLLWKKQVVPILGSHNLLGYVDDTIPPPQRMITSQDGREEINPEFPNWETTDQMVMSLINNTLSEEVLGQTIGFANHSARPRLIQDLQSLKPCNYDTSCKPFSTVHTP
ncbi:hypothetical protein GIB67_027230 [Kingdonia uniflora]|uniref:Retrotransposon Copia-like N-terminal domain-containing protein n=1 Tax=Kingdonia uniflora TaxID=39325 RepID=A0A7J7KYB6_9MAGN|nr:hypothetical protein GIB67_027230 [Kingdonia uniflora]